MKKKLKKILIAFLIILLLFCGFLAIWVWLIFPHIYPEQVDDDETVIGEAEIAENSETIDFDEETGMLYVNNEIVVFINDTVSEEDIAGFLEKYHADIDDTMSDIGVYKLIFADAMEYEELENLVNEMKSSSIVEDAYLNTVFQLEEDVGAKEDDFDYKDAVYPVDDWNGDGWNVAVPGGENWGMEAINAPGAWGYLDQLSETKIGLIDTMPNTKHDDLKSMFSGSSCLFVNENTGKTIVNKYQLTSQDHGTHVSGIMAANWNNKVGVAGVTGGKCRLYYAATYYDSNGAALNRYATAYSYLLALKTLIDQDVQAINISQNTSRLVGFAASHGNQNAINYLTRQADLAEGGLSRIISTRTAAGKSDFVICVAAGNSNSTYYYKDDSETYGYREEMTWWEKVKYFFGWRGEIGDSLALYNNFLNLMDEKTVIDRVIVVGAVGIDSVNSTTVETRYTYTDFSNVGSRVDVSAPGDDIYSCTSSGYESMSGTSMACPHVTGVAGLIFAANPSLTGPEVKSIVKSSVSGRYNYTGGYSGMINANTAVVNALKTKETAVEHVLKTETQGGLDLCFVIDTTGSMGDDIENAKENMTEILAHLADKTTDYRVALIDYRDFSSRSGDADDYPYKVQLRLTNSEDSIVNAIDSLTLGSGGDTEETVYSALMAAVDLNWRDDAQKVVIILGDAAPLDPEPNTDYTYEDVLLALFNADIGVDYEDSDDRVVNELDDSLIHVFSIGTDASSDAEDFLKNISDSTGGAYVGVEDASEVGDAIIDSIEQIDVAETVTANLDFGDSLAKQEIYIYSESNYLFAIQTDENGEFVINDMEYGIYKWKCNNVYAGGTIFVESNAADSSVRTTQAYAFANASTFIQSHKLLTTAGMLLFVLLCILIPVIIKQVRRLFHRKNKKNNRTIKAGKQRYCPACGSEVSRNARFCGVCGASVQEPAVTNEKKCPVCGTVSSANEAFCRECGYNLNEQGGEEF